MALFKRGKMVVDGLQRQRGTLQATLRTKDWRQAQSREKELITQASAGKLVPSSQKFARLGFTEATDRVLVDLTVHLAPRSITLPRCSQQFRRVQARLTGLTWISTSPHTECVLKIKMLPAASARQPSAFEPG